MVEEILLLQVMVLSYSGSYGSGVGSFCVIVFYVMTLEYIEYMEPEVGRGRQQFLHILCRRFQ